MIRTWFDGALREGNISLSPQDRGLTLGDGLFETMAVTNDVVLWQEEHLARLQKACAELGLPCPLPLIATAIAELVKGAKGHHVLRLTLTRGAGARGLAETPSKPTVLATLQPFDDTLRFQPLSLAISSIRRNLQSPTCCLKTLSYIDNILAAKEAAATGADDGLMLNTAGRIACATVGNVFLEIDGALVTPSLKEGILPGIMREAVIKQATQLGLKVRERQVRPSDIARADAMCVTNSLRFLRNVSRCDNKRFTKPSKPLDSLCKALLNAEQEQIILKRG